MRKTTTLRRSRRRPRLFEQLENRLLLAARVFGDGWQALHIAEPDTQATDGVYIDVDSAGSTYSVGSFEGSTLDLGVDIETSTDLTPANATQRAYFVAKHAEVGDLLWAELVEAQNGVGHITAAAHDRFDNTIVAGVFNGTLTPSNLTGEASAENHFVLVFNPDGELIQELKFVNTDGYAAASHVFSVTADNDGNILVAGEFTGTIDFTPGVEGGDVTVDGREARYIARFDSVGAFQWVKLTSDTHSNWSQLLTDSHGNGYLVNNMSGGVTVDVDLDNDISNNNIAVTTDAESFGGTFVLKFDQDGNFLEVNAFTQLAGPSLIEAHSATIGPDDALYFTGVAGNIDFDPGEPVTTLAPADFGFVARYGAGGDLAWLRGIEFREIGQRLEASALDGAGNIHIVGKATKAFDVNPDPDGIFTLEMPDQTPTAFVLTLDAAGDFVAARRYVSHNSNGDSIGSDIAATSNGTVHVIGTFNGWVDFDPGEEDGQIRERFAFDGPDAFVATVFGSPDEQPVTGIDRWWGTVGVDETVSVDWTVTITETDVYAIDIDIEGSGAQQHWDLHDDAVVIVNGTMSDDFNSTGRATLGRLTPGTYTFTIDSFVVPETGVVDEVQFELFKSSICCLADVTTLNTLFVADFPSGFADDTAFVIDTGADDPVTVDEAGLVDLFAPTLHFSTGEQFAVPFDVDAFLVDLQDRSGDVLFEQNRGDAEDWLNLAAYANPPEPFTDANTASAIYGSVLVCQEQHTNCTPGDDLAISYYWFTPRSNWGEHGGFNTHEGDWEGGVVFLTSQDDGSWSPSGMALAQHVSFLGAGGGIFMPQMLSAGPDVFVGLGGHASYEVVGTTTLLTANGLQSEVHDGEISSELLNSTPLGRADGHGWISYSGRWGNPDLNDDGLSLSDGAPYGPVYQATDADGSSRGFRWLQPWEWTVGLPEVTHADTDGISDAMEDGAPNAGDGNDDGVLDKLQDTVASFASLADSAYTSLVTSAGTVHGVSFFPADMPNSEIDTPLGSFDFEVAGLNSGEAITVTYLVDGVATNDFYIKEHGQWVPFRYDGETGAIVNGTEITVHYVDGGRGDADGVANGVVVDPGLPVVDAYPWHNWDNQHDVNLDNFVTPIDALVIINLLNGDQRAPGATGLSSGPLPIFGELVVPDRAFYDTNGDGYATAIDALLVINRLNAAVTAEGEAVSLANTFIVAPAYPTFVGGVARRVRDDSKVNTPSIESFIPPVTETVDRAIDTIAPSVTRRHDSQSSVDRIMTTELDDVLEDLCTL